MIVGIPFSYHSGSSFDFTFFKYSSNIIFFFLLFALVESLSQLKTVLLIVCFSTLFQAVMSLIQGNFINGRLHPGTMFDPNDLAFFMVSFLPLFFIFIRKKEQSLRKGIAFLGLLLSFFTILATGSRGGLLGLASVIAVTYTSKILINKKSTKLLIGLLIILTAFLNADKINIDRLTSISDLSSDYNVTSDTGRLKVWERGIRLVIENPITGVGVLSFNRAIGRQREADGEKQRWQAAHNSFVQIASELGLVGFFIFISLIIVCLFNFLRLSTSNLNIGLPDDYINIAGSCAIGLFGSLICAFFLTQGYSVILTFYFSVSASLRKLVAEHAYTK